MTRSEVLATLFRRAGPRRVWGIDSRGRGGVLPEPGAEKTQPAYPHGWGMWSETLVLACVEGDERWTRLPAKE